MKTMIELLRQEPALAWKLMVQVKGEAEDGPAARHAARQVAGSPLVTALLAERDPAGGLPHHPYKKWNGAHWLLASLADLGYPPGEQSLRPLLESVLAWLLGPEHARYIRQVNGRTRRCASLEGNAAWYSLRLGLADGRVEALIARLLTWQWPDGGWNCDKRPEAHNSSFMESLIPLRALALFARLSGDRKAALAAEHASEIFLARRLFLRRTNGQVMDRHFILLSYPPYWHYQILFGLKVLAEAGLLSDPRCQPALDLLESKRLPGGGFPAEESYSRTTRPALSGYSLVDWGGTGLRRANPFVTADALFVLRLAGRQA